MTDSVHTEYTSVLADTQEAMSADSSTVTDVAVIPDIPDYARPTYDGNPSGVSYTPVERDAKFQTFLDCLTDGMSTRRACKHVGISWRTLSLWIVGHDGYDHRYNQAREASAEAWADKALRYAHTPLDKREVPAARLKWDDARWRASVMAPKRWSDKQNNVQVNVAVQLTTLHLDALRKRLPSND